MSQLKIDFLDIKDAFIVTGKKFSDERGFFEEIYNESKFSVPITKKWVQVSLAESKVDVLRGMHCSNYAKFVTCVKGEVFDVIVDLRPDSPTFMKWQGVSLNSSSSDPVSLYVPKRCGHGYYCKQQDSLLVYLQDGCFNGAEDINVHPFDPSLNIQWPKPFSNYIISEKDKTSKQFSEIKHLLDSSKTSLLNPLKDKAVLVYGGTGFLGKCLLEELVKLNKPFRIGAARLENRSDLLKEIKETAPSHVICMAGLTGKPNIFWCEKNQIETIRVNVIGQLNIADVTNEFNLHCTLITTGITYTYDEYHKVNSGKGFTEEEKPNFDRNFYSKMRIMEEELLKSYPNVLNLRVQYPATGDMNPSSFIQKIVKFKQIQSIPLSLTIVDDLWPVLIDMAEKKVAGTFNFNNPGSISHDEILQAYKAVVDNNHEWETVDVDLSNRSAAELSADKLLKLGYKIPHVKDSVQALMKKILEEKTGAQIRLSPTQSKYEPKNILLTGGAGFIGSHVVIHLVKKYKNCHVFVYDILDYCSNLKNLDEIKDEVNYTFIKGDICNFQMVQFVINSYKIDTIMHFAAQSHVDFSIRNSIKFTKVNVLGTHVLLENARLSNVKRFIHVSTDEVYGTTDDKPNMNQALDPTNPYACSKLAAECIIMAYRKCFKLPIIISRGNNVYGPHQFLEKVIPKFISRLNKNLKCCVHGDGSSERDFLYVTDVANAFDYLLHHGEPNEFYNIGASNGITVLELAKKIVKIMKNTNGNEMDFIEFHEGRILDDKRYKIDSSKIRSTGWKENIDFDKGLKLTVDWYLANPNHWPQSDFALSPHPDTALIESGNFND